MKIKKLLLIIITIIFFSMALYVAMLAFSWRNDISEQEPYAYSLNTPLEIQKLSAITTSPISNRFKKHNLYGLHPEFVEAQTIKKIYKIGDKIQFYAAKSFYNMHIGTSYHLIGRDTLNSGAVIEFEYPLSDYSPRVWETMEGFLKRKKTSRH